MDRRPRIGILLSGRPGERELALRQGETIAQAMTERGHDVVPIFVDGELDLLVRQAKIDTAFVALQGRYGADGCAQGFLELIGIPYTGSGVLASALAANRVKTKEVWRLRNLPTAAGYVYDRTQGEALLDRHGSFGFPVLVRPVRAAAMPAEMTAEIANDELDLQACAEHVLHTGDEVLIERHLTGRRIQVGILDGRPIGAMEAATGRGKRLLGALPKLSDERLRSVLRLASLAYESLCCAGATVVAIQVSDRGNEIVTDIDTMPAITPVSPLARIAAIGGMALPDLIENIFQGAALHGHGHKENRRYVQVSFGGPERRRGATVQAH